MILKCLSDLVFFFRNVSKRWLEDDFFPRIEWFLCSAEHREKIALRGIHFPLNQWHLKKQGGVEDDWCSTVFQFG